MWIYPLVLLLSTAPPPEPDAAALYAKMALAMNAVRQPAVANYDETVYPRGLSVRNVEANGQEVVHLVYSSDKNPHVFEVTQCSSRNSVYVVDPTSGQHYSAEQPFFAAIWARAEQTSVIGAARQRMIADLTTATSDAYDVTMAPPQEIGGYLTYHLLLTARSDAGAHPLTDLYLDEQTLLPRRAVASFQDDTVARVTGVITLNFERAGEYWIVGSGEVAATVHAYFRQVSGSAAFVASNVTFPSGPCSYPVTRTRSSSSRFVSGTIARTKMMNTMQSDA